MAQVAITINGRPYSIACEDGQEDRLRDLAMDLDGEVRNLAAAVGQIGDSRLLVIAGLSLVDRMNEFEAELKELRAQSNAGQGVAQAAQDQARQAAETVARLEAQLAAALQRIEALTASLEKA